MSANVSLSVAKGKQDWISAMTGPGSRPARHVTLDESIYRLPNGSFWAREMVFSPPIGETIMRGRDLVDTFKGPKGEKLQVIVPGTELAEAASGIEIFGIGRMSIAIEPRTTKERGKIIVFPEAVTAVPEMALKSAHMPVSLFAAHEPTRLPVEVPDSELAGPKTKIRELEYEPGANEGLRLVYRLKPNMLSPMAILMMPLWDSPETIIFMTKDAGKKRWVVLEQQNEAPKRAELVPATG